MKLKLLVVPLVFTTLSFLLTGCGAFVPIQTLDKTGIDIVLAAAKMPIVSTEKARTMQVIGEVVGYSCMNKSNEPNASKVGATDQTKIVAAQSGAIAITGLVCTESGVSLVSNCWHSWEYRATALK